MSCIMSYIIDVLSLIKHTVELDWDPLVEGLGPLGSPLLGQQNTKKL